MKKSVLILALSFIAISIFAQSRVSQHNNKVIRIEFQLPDIVQEQISIRERKYTRLSYRGNEYLIKQGAPLIPHTVNHIAIPPEAQASVQFQIHEQNEIRPIDVLPAILISGTNGVTTVPVNDTIYGSSTAFPGPIVQISDPYIYRNMQVVDLKIYPVQFYPLEKRVQLHRRISIQITIDGGEFGGSNRAFSKTERNFLQKRFLNFEQAQNWVIQQPARFAKTQVTYDFSTGEWYKIPITQEGIYQITGSFLSNQGVDISDISVNTIQMFNYGGMPLSANVNDSIPYDLNEIAIDVRDNNSNGIFNENDVIYFYGRGVNGWKINEDNPADPLHPWESYHHPYATRNYYILTFNQNPGKRIPQENSIQESNPVVPSAFMDHYRFEEDRFSLIQTGKDWYWIRLSGLSDQAALNFTLPQNLAPGNMKINISFASKLSYTDPANFSSTLDIFINSQTIKEDLIIYAKDTATETIVYDDIFAIQGGINEISFQHNSNVERASPALDYFEIYFQRPFQAENNHLKINYLLGTNATEYRVSNLAGSGNRIWDVTDFADVKEINPLQNSNTVIYQDKAASQTAKEYLVFSNSAIRAVQQIEPIDNNPNLRDPSRNGKLIVILPDEFYTAAEPFEIFKETLLFNPIETERVRLSQIYREFSSCVQDPTAIRNFIKYARNNWGANSNEYPEYVLLLGDGSYDYKGIELPNYINRVPTYQINGVDDLRSRESDHYYVALNNNNLDPELAIGRVPVNATSEIETFVKKISDYEKSHLSDPAGNGWQTTLTFVSDDEATSPTDTSEWFHLIDTKALIRNNVPEKFDLRKIYLTEYPIQPGGFSRTKPLATEALIGQLNRGTLMINFFGHGNPDTWAHEQVFSRSRDLGKIQNEGRLPLWVAATCSWGHYDDPSQNSMAEEMIWLRDRGGIAVIAASRAVFATSNASLVNRFYGNLLNENTSSKILGYGLLQALGGSSNDQKFRLFGDPSMKLADPEHTIEITNIIPDTLKALSTAEISAEIRDTTGNRLTDFQGEAIIRVFDTKDTVTVNNTQIGSFTKQEKVIFKGRVSVVNGELTGQFIVPKSIKYDQAATGRISIYAWNEDGSSAGGYEDSLSLFGTESLTDNQGPTMDLYFEGQEDFFDGDYVSTQPTMVVRISDESGINLTQEVGHRIELSIDDKIQTDITEYFVYDKDSYQTGQLRYTLPALSPGNHTLTITAWDNVNNIAEREVNFRTIQVNELALEQVVNYPNPFDEDTHFTFQFQSPTGLGEVTIRIYTVTGRLTQEIETIAQPGFNKVYWDGRDRDGDMLANGVYLYKIIVDDGQRKIEKIEKLAVLR